MSLWSLLLPDKWDLLVILFQLIVAMLSAVICLLLAGIVILIGKVGRCVYGKIKRSY